MRLEITASNVGFISTKSYGFLTIEDSNGSRLDVTLSAEVMDYLEEAIKRERRIGELLEQL